MAIQISGTTVIDDNRNINAGIGTFTELAIPPVPVAFNPTSGTTGTLSTSDIRITFNTSVVKGTGNITLRENSASGTVLQTIGVSSSSVTVSGGEVIIDPPSDMGDLKNIYVVVDADAFESAGGIGNAIINTYNFTTAFPPLGNAFEGGFLICQGSGVRWIVAPSSTEVTRCWASRADAINTANATSGCTGWFIPTCSQLQNPGACRAQYWDAYCCGKYWSDSLAPPVFVRAVCIPAGYAGGSYATATFRTRSFRCVTY